MLVHIILQEIFALIILVINIELLDYFVETFFFFFTVKFRRAAGCYS